MSPAVVLGSLEPDAVRCGPAPRTTATRCASSARWTAPRRLVDRCNRGVLAITGPERLTWLHNLTTQHLLALAPGEGTELLVLSPHGHVEHHAVLTDDGDDHLAGCRAGGTAAACWTSCSRCGS